MALPPYLIPNNPWAAQLIAQQQALVAAHAQQQHQTAYNMQAGQVAMQIPPPTNGVPAPAQGNFPDASHMQQHSEILTEDKLRDKAQKWQQLQSKRFADKRKFGFVLIKNHYF